MKKINKQAGIGLFGIVLILAMIGAIGYFGLKLFPLYSEYGGIKSALAYIEGLPADKVKSSKQVYEAFRKNAQVNGLQRFTYGSAENLYKVQKDKKTGKRYFNIKYQNSETLFKNIKVMIDVDETVPLAGK